MPTTARHAPLMLVSAVAGQSQRWLRASSRSALVNLVDVAAKPVTITGDAAEAAVRAAIDEAGYDVASVTAASDSH